MRKMTSAIERLARKTRKTSSCWEWIGSLTGSGYGQIQRDGGRAGGIAMAHRLAYELYVGPIPEGMSVCHHCDNKICVNPTHLFLGSPADNSRDAAEKGRIERGESRHNAIFTVADIREIRRLRQQGQSGVKLAKQFGVSNSHIYSILSGQVWGWLK